MVDTAARTERDQIVAIATDYLAAFYEGSGEERAACIERAVHPHLAKRSPAWVCEDGSFHEWTFPAMVDGASKSVDDDTSAAPYSVRVLDISPRMASVRTAAHWGVDYMHLAKIDGQWKVVNVLWDDPAPTSDAVSRRW